MLYEVCMLLAENMLRLSGLAEDDREARAKLTKAIETGAGLKKLEQMLTALGARDAKACIADPDTLCTVKRRCRYISMAKATLPVCMPPI